MKWLHLLRLLGVLLLLGQSRLAVAEEECQPLSAKTLEEKLQEAYSNIQFVDYQTCFDILNGIERDLACTRELVPARLLGDLFVYRGLATYLQGQSEEAEALFTKAWVIYPGLKWNPEFGQKTRETFLNGKARSLEVAPVNVKCPVLAPSVQAYLDGKELTQGADFSILPGRHFLQLQYKRGVWVGEFVEIAAKAPVLPLPADAVAVPVAVSPPTTPPSNPTPPVDKPERRWTALNSAQVSAGVAGAGVIGFAVGGIGYWSTRSKLASTGYENTPENQELLGKNRVYALTADASLVVALVSAGGAVYFYKQHLNSPAWQARLSFQPWIARSGGGLGFSFQF